MNAFFLLVFVLERGIIHWRVNDKKRAVRMVLRRKVEELGLMLNDVERR